MAVLAGAPDGFAVLGGDDAFLFPTVLVGAIFAEPNPAVVKALMHAAGRIPTPDVRMPLSAASAEALE